MPRRRQGGYGLGFALEARERRRILREPLRQHFHGHFATELFVASAIDVARAAAAERTKDFVRAQTHT